MKKPLPHKSWIDDVATPPSEPIRTTLFDLIAAMQDVAASPEDQKAVTAAATHVLNTHRVICEGRFKGARFVGEARLVRGCGQARFSQFDKAAVSF